jgi:hypothetical protein
MAQVSKGWFQSTGFFFLKYTIHLIYSFQEFFHTKKNCCLQGKVVFYKYAAAYVDPGQLVRKGGDRDEDQEEGHLERARQTAGSKVLGNDEGC